MERIELEVFSQASNFAIVRMPGRKFPGAVIQGDSLYILTSLARAIYQRVKESPDTELADAANELQKLLSTRLSHYGSVLKDHNLELPYD